MRFDATSRFLLTTGDKYVRVLHNVPGYKATLQELETKLRQASTASQRERIQVQLNEAQSLLELFGD